MTVPVPGSLIYIDNADGVTTSFSYPVRFLDKAEIVVLLRDDTGDTLQVLGTDYTIAGSSWPTGGTVAFNAAPGTGKKVVRYRNTTAKQVVDLENTQRNDAGAVETQLDRLAMVGQDQNYRIGVIETKTAAIDQAVIDAGIARDGAEAAQAAAEDAAAVAEAAADIASGSMTTVLDPQFATKAAAEAWEPAAAPDYVRTAGYGASGDLGDSIYIKSGDATGDLVLQEGGITPVGYIRRNHFVTPQMCGAIAGSASVQDAAFVNAAKNAIEDGIPLVINGEFKLDVVDLSGVAAGGSLRIEHRGKLTHIDSSSDHMFAFGTRDAVDVIGRGIFDGNKDQQTANRLIMPVDLIDNFYLWGSRFQNIKYGAVHMRRPVMPSFVMENFQCKDGALHNGVLNGQYCYFVALQGGKHVRISDFSMVQTADPTGTQCRQPAGIFHINTSPSGIVGQTCIIENGYLSNLGHNVAGNLVGVVDFYSRVESIEVKNLRIEKPRSLPIRTNYATKAVIEGNYIWSTEQMIVDGGSAYADASGIAAVTVNRGYSTDFGGLDDLTISNNRVRIQGTQECRGIYINNSDTASLARSVTVENNSVTHTGTNSTSRGILALGVTSYEDLNNSVTGFSIGREFQATDTAASAVLNSSPRYSVRGGRTNAATSAIYARTGVTNLDLTIDDHTSIGGTASYSVRNAKSVRVQRCTLSDAGDTSANAAFWFRDNNATGTTQPAGYSSNTYYRLRDNVGRADVASP